MNCSYCILAVCRHIGVGFTVVFSLTCWHAKALLGKKNNLRGLRLLLY